MEYLALERGEKIEHPPGSLRAIAQAALLKASGGDTPTINLVGDRLDGKPAQAIIGGDEDDPAIQVDNRDLSRAVLALLASGVNKDEPK